MINFGLFILNWLSFLFGKKVTYTTVSMHFRPFDRICSISHSVIFIFQDIIYYLDFWTTNSFLLGFSRFRESLECDLVRLTILWTLALAYLSAAYCTMQGICCHSYIFNNGFLVEAFWKGLHAGNLKPRLFQQYIGRNETRVRVYTNVFFS